VLVQTVCFDFDGVIVDSRVAISIALNKVLKRHKLPLVKDIGVFIGPPLQESLKMVAGKENSGELFIEVRQEYAKVYLAHTTLFEGVKETIQDLHAKGLKIILTTVKPAVFAEPLLEKFHIRECFDLVIGSPPLDKPELTKEEVLKLAKKHIKGKGCIVGDRKYDIEGGKKTGLLTIGVTYGSGSKEEIKNSKPDFIIDSIIELSKLPIF